MVINGFGRSRVHTNEDRKDLLKGTFFDEDVSYCRSWGRTWSFPYQNLCTTRFSRCADCTQSRKNGYYVQQLREQHIEAVGFSADVLNIAQLEAALLSVKETLFASTHEGMKNSPFQQLRLSSCSSASLGACRFP